MSAAAGWFPKLDSATMLAGGFCRVEKMFQNLCCLV
jgi:hypothetical protein